MNILISTHSLTPIYEQIIHQVQKEIREGTVPPGCQLPSVRVLARQLQISALTVKKAYDALEKQGYIQTVPGKGSFIIENPALLIREENQKAVESLMDQAIARARQSGLKTQEIRDLFELLLRENRND